MEIEESEIGMEMGVGWRWRWGWGWGWGWDGMEMEMGGNKGDSDDEMFHSRMNCLKGLTLYLWSMM